MEATAGPSSERSELNKINESPANAELIASDKLQTDKDNSVVTAPPSPQTLLAIQAAMVESSSEEELGNEDKERLNLTRSVMEEGSVSPRTLRAIQQALNDDDEKEEVVTVRADRVQTERSKAKDFLLSSSDEEDQIPEVKEDKEVLISTIHSSNQAIVQDIEFEQKSQELGKNCITPKGTSMSTDKNYSCVDDTEKGKEVVDTELNGSKIDSTYLEDKDVNLCIQKPSCSSSQASIGPLVHSETAGFSKTEENLKICEITEEVHSQTEESVSEVQKETEILSPTDGPKEGREGTLQSEDSDSDGMCILIE